MFVIKENNLGFGYVYAELLRNLLYNPEYQTSPRNLVINEYTDVFFELDNPRNVLLVNTIRSTPLKYLAAELVWYFTGDKKIDYISKYAKFWNNIANEDNTVNSAYGNLLFKETNEYGYNEWQWAFKQLINDKDTRQSIIRFNKPHHNYDNNKDFPCTLNGIFNIRDNKLNLSINMRSSDIIRGITFDIPFFTTLQQQMLLHLKPHYTDLELGKFYFYTKSLHLYNEHFNLGKDMVNNAIYSSDLPEMKKNLINTNGENTVTLDYIKKGFDIDEKDKFYRFIYENLKENV